MEVGVNVQLVYLFYRRWQVYVDMWDTSFCCDWLAQWASNGVSNLFSYIGASWSEGAPTGPL